VAIALRFRHANKFTRKWQQLFRRNDFFLNEKPPLSRQIALRAHARDRTAGSKHGAFKGKAYRALAKTCLSEASCFCGL
jgi:hypothetical protein